MTNNPPGENAQIGDAPRSRSKIPRVALIALIVVLAAIVVAGHVQLNYYSITPGDAQPVGPLITVPAKSAHQIRGKVLLTDVFVSQLTALQMIPTLLSSDAQVVSGAQLLGPYTPPDQLTAQGYVEMAQSQAAAKAAALSHLGYQVSEENVGALVFATVPGTPASSALRVGQIIKSVGSTQIATACDFIRAVHSDPPGSVVRLSVEQSTATSQGVIAPGKVVEVGVRLATRPSSLPSDTGCSGVVGPSAGYLGVTIQTQQSFTYPIPVGIRTSDIGGPSAGLAMTLGIMDKLSSGNLTRGRVVAATGTIDPSGDVGDVGGVAQKTIAVERAGATVFLVPPAEYRAAMSKDNRTLHIYPVSTLDQALNILRRLG